MCTVAFMWAVAWGNIPQWVSAGAAIVVVLAGAILLTHGRRTDLDVTATAHSLPSGTVLDVRAKLRPIGSFKNRAYGPLGCTGCAAARTSPAGSRPLAPSESWVTDNRCPSESSTSAYDDRDLHLLRFRKHAKGMKDRRLKWGCTNRKIPFIEIREVRLNQADSEAPPQDQDERLVRTIMNAFRGQFAEPQEALQVTHIVPVDTSDPAVMGWRVLLVHHVPMETWFLRRPSHDSWSWEDDDFVPRPEMPVR
jgi:hypothetical protein